MGTTFDNRTPAEKRAHKKMLNEINADMQSAHEKRDERAGAEAFRQGDAENPHTINPARFKAWQHGYDSEKKWWDAQI